MSYNVLAQGLLENHSYLLERCELEYLLWENRSELLYEEIIDQSPDILCIQELESTYLNSFFSRFEEIGYYGLYKKKTSRGIDGCGIYFKKDYFKLEDVVDVEFYQPKVSILNRHHVGIIAKLSSFSMPEKPFVVANTHLLHNPKKALVRLAQLRIFLAEIDRVSYVFNGRDSGYLPIILLGDFNSYPDSLVVQLLNEGQVNTRLDFNNNEWTDIGITDNCQHLSVYLNRKEGRHTSFSEVQIYNSVYSNQSRMYEPQAPTKQFRHTWFSEMFTSGILSQPFHFRSVYDTRRRKNNFYTEASNGKDYIVVDYIYYNACSGLRPLERLHQYTDQEIKEFGKLPNNVFGSDHISLVAVFELSSKRPY
ncbi:protein angel homolog 2-like [Helicoverpa zea]|uniref:protein angel homolog 2-like n=1 Tax=Helicoverpa zea TaxID=7113 RepID=UPI001F5AF5C4|nr:protein angel homolog 2-like [Helicoverpa zea]